MTLLAVENLSVSFPSGASRFFAVSNLSFEMAPGETVCLVGESGSGKSLTALAVMGLLPDTARMEGNILFEGTSLMDSSLRNTGHRYCGDGMSMVFQEPTASLNPTMRVQDILLEALRFKRSLTGEAAMVKAREALVSAGVEQPDAVLGSYSWQLSGGLAQRAVIASALVLEPRMLIADEPTTALDVTTQARILRVLSRLQREHELSLLFITHDLTIAALLGGRTIVMIRGLAVEEGPTQMVLDSPLHPFTRTLVQATPGFALDEGRNQLYTGQTSSGSVMDTAACPFFHRCPHADPRCKEGLTTREHDNRRVLCWNPLEELT